MNIRGGGKTVHVVLKYLSKSLLYRRGGGDRVTLTSSHPHPISLLWSVDISFKRRPNRSSPPRCFLHSSLSCFLRVDLGTLTIERLPFCKLNILWTEEQLTCLVFRVCKFLQGVPKVCLLDLVSTLQFLSCIFTRSLFLLKGKLFKKWDRPFVADLFDALLCVGWSRSKTKGDRVQ